MRQLHPDTRTLWKIPYMSTESYDAFFHSVAGSQSAHNPPCHSVLQRSRLEMEQQDLLVITMAHTCQRLQALYREILFEILVVQAIVCD